VKFLKELALEILIIEGCNSLLKNWGSLVLVMSGMFPDGCECRERKHTTEVASLGQTWLLLRSNIFMIGFLLLHCKMVFKRK
jgi:hypothetical protein